jgi:hypothetical protein
VGRRSTRIRTPLHPARPRGRGRPCGDRFYGIRSFRLRVWRSSFTRWCTVLRVSPMYMRKCLQVECR